MTDFDADINQVMKEAFQKTSFGMMGFQQRQLIVPNLTVMLNFPPTKQQEQLINTHIQTLLQELKHTFNGS